MRTFKMSRSQSDEFSQLVTIETASQHGERRMGEDIELHSHEEIAVYQVVSGRAWLVGEDGPVAILGPNEMHDSVEVGAWERHGWRIMADKTRIEHVTTSLRVKALLAVI